MEIFPICIQDFAGNMTVKRWHEVLEEVLKNFFFFYILKIQNASLFLQFFIKKTISIKRKIYFTLT